jgi:hypothetical protein
MRSMYVDHRNIEYLLHSQIFCDWTLCKDIHVPVLADHHTQRAACLRIVQPTVHCQHGRAVHNRHSTGSRGIMDYSPLDLQNQLYPVTFFPFSVKQDVLARE